MVVLVSTQDVVMLVSTMDCFPGYRGLIAFFVRENFQDFVFLSENSQLLLKYVPKKRNKTSPIINSYCRRRSVPVGVPTL